MDALVRLIVTALPLLVLFLLAGLGLIIQVVANEGRGRSTAWTRVVGLVDLALAVPFVIVAVAAETNDVRWMFVFGAATFATIGAMALRAVARYRE